MRYRGWAVALALLLVVWGAYAVVSWRVRVPDTAEAAALLIPPPSEFGRMRLEDRKAAITRLSEAVSRLPFPERDALGKRPESKAFVESLTEEDRIWYVKQVMPKRLKEALERFSGRPPKERAEIVERAIEEMRRRPEGKRLSGEEEQRARAELGRPEASEAYRSIMRFYFSEMTPEQKGELAPLIREVAEQFQKASK